MSAALAALALLSPSQAAPQASVTLARKFAVGERLQYAVRGAIQIEQRSGMLQTFIPEDLDVGYDFTLETLRLKADGIADLRYLRPNIKETQGQTFDAPPKTRVEKLDQRVRVTVSPINELLGYQDEPKPKKPAKKPRGGTLRLLNASLRQGGDPFGPFISEVQRLALFIGPIDSSLDFNPKLPFDAVQVGETWKRTVGYSPQKLKGKSSQAVQRLDYVYTYKGLVKSEGRTVQRVRAELELNTDLADFFHQLTDSNSSDTGLKSFPLKFKGQIDFDLDPKTGRTLYAVGTSQGGFSIATTEAPNEPVMEQRFKGETTMRLVKAGVVPKK